MRVSFSRRTGPKQRGAAPRPRRFTPRLEGLEDRSLLNAAIPGVTLDPSSVPQFKNALPDPLSPGFIYQPNGTTTVTLENGSTATVPLYHVGAFQIQENLGLGLTDKKGNPVKTTVYGYGTSAATATYPGQTFVVDSGSPIAVQWTDGLTSTTHLLPVDPTLLNPADNKANGGQLYNVDSQTVKNTPVTGTTHAQVVTFPRGIPIDTHVHGGHTQAIFDGTPLEWFTPKNGPTGADFPGTTTFTYDNSQQAGTIWYHDHTDGITRVNVYAGLAGFYIIHDANENSLIANHNLPNEQFDIPLAIQDRMFTAPGFASTNDPGGQLYYPSDVLAGTTATYPSEHPEMFGDTILVNGQAWPVLNVEPRTYRFRILDGSEARFYNLFFATSKDPTTAQAISDPFYQIGTDDGLLPAPVHPTANALIGGQTGYLTIAPGERDDVVFDFSQYKPGDTIYLLNNAPAPFPGGEEANYNPATVGRIMAFHVVDNTSGIQDVSNLATKQNPTPPLNPAAANNTRDQALFETTDSFGRLIQELGTPSGGAVLFMNSKGAADTVQLIRNKDGSQSVIEVWRVFNTTADTHPIHLHQVSFQILSRQDFMAVDNNGVAYATLNPADPGYAANTTGPFSYTLLGTPAGPYANEVGAWKDTVQMNPGTVTTIIAKFDLPGTYVWHCHILEHEEHDMMHWLVVKPAPAGATAATAVAAPSAADTTGTQINVSVSAAAIATPAPAGSVTASPSGILSISAGSGTTAGAPAAVMDQSKTSAEAVTPSAPLGYAGPATDTTSAAQDQVYANYEILPPDNDPAVDPLTRGTTI